LLVTNMKNKYDHASKMLQKKRDRLISGFLNKRDPLFLEHNARILDDYFRESFERSEVGPIMRINKNPYAIFALGGYGREEQCIHSDVDLLFLFEKNVPDKTEDLIKEILYPLWDIGLDVGHATRSIKECVSLSGKDLEVLTSVLDARFICGVSLLYSELMEQILKKVIIKRSDKIINRLIESNLQRHDRFGDSTNLLEPNIKEGQGGLRDYHTMLWIGRIKYNIKQPRDLEYYGCLSYDEFKILSEALSFIWEVRNRLHYIAGRKCDQLYFEYQTELANALNFRKQNGLQPVERFLSKLHSRMEVLKQQKYAIVFMGSFASILVYTTDATMRVDPTLRRAAMNLGASPLQILRYVILPGALPDLLTGLKVVLAIAWTCVISAEMVGANSGLGFRIWTAKEWSDTGQVLVGMISISVTVLVLDILFRGLERVLLPYQRKTSGT